LRTLPEHVFQAAAAAARRPSAPLAVAGACRLPAALERALSSWAGLVEDPRDASAHDLHALRVSVKRARYAAALFGPAFGGPVDRLVEDATEVQDALGEVQDAQSGRATLSTLLGRGSKRGRGVGPAEKAAATVAASLDASARRARKRARKALA